MKLVKIKNKHMYLPKRENDNDYNPEGIHIYAVETDKKTKRTWAVRLTHIYEPEKEKRIKRGQLIVMKLPGLNFPSGVSKQRRTEDVHGEVLDLKKVEAVNINGKKATYLSKKQAEKIKGFSKYEKPKKQKNIPQKRKHR